MIDGLRATVVSVQEVPDGAFRRCPAGHVGESPPPSAAELTVNLTADTPATIPLRVERGAAASAVLTVRFPPDRKSGWLLYVWELDHLSTVGTEPDHLRPETYRTLVAPV